MSHKAKPITQAMVLAAGLGTRLRPITEHMPKPLVPVAGRPMIDYVLDLLVDAGIQLAVVNVHHFADQMEAHLARETRLNIRISDERAALLNSGGGLRKGLALLDTDKPVLVMNADLFWINEPTDRPGVLRRAADDFDAERMDMLLICVPLSRTTGHNGKKDFSLAEDGRLTRYDDGLTNPVVYAGAMILDPGIFAQSPDGAFNLNILFDHAIEAGRLHGIMMDGDWITVGTPDAIGEAEAVLARRSA